MNTIDIILSENANFKFVAVQFNGTPKLYHYKTTLDLVPDDHVIVFTPQNGYQVVQVIKVVSPFEVPTAQFDYKWVVQKVDTAAYDQAVETEATLSAELRRIEAKRRLNEMREELKQAFGDEMANLQKLVRL